MMNDEFGDITGAWDYGALPANVVVGRGCWFERKDSFGTFRSAQQPGLVIGDRVRVYTWATFNVEPSGVVEKVGSAVNLDEHRVKGDLERFKSFIENRGNESGSWRGDIPAGS